MRLKGDTVTVRTRIRDARDTFGNDVEEYSAPVNVSGVLIAPGSARELDATRPEGVTVALTLYFPKTWTESLRAAKVTITGRYAGEYKVVGEPMPYPGYFKRFTRNLIVEVEATDG